ncbi:ABC transporter substrate-binding protein [Streptomyces sp. NPDC020917]|uniref:ABC transporter substrate-binding protein n=1 Tax=Streptomyces sp. NPDC020917 TaxID=3365102 RepID=UPI00379A3A8D
MRAGAMVLAVASLVTLNACSSGKDSGSGSPKGSSSVSLDFWGWAPGYDKSVALWNKTHPNIKVNFSKVPSGSGGGYTKMQNAVKAGNAPCLAQIGNESVPTFVVNGALEDVSAYANQSKDQFVEWTWKQSSLGDKVFGIPVDTGPTALFYRKDLFSKYHLPVPGTWQDFAADAEKFHAAGPENYLINAPVDSYDMAGYTWQAGGHWFGTANDQWQVTIDGAETQKVTQYWQGLLDKKLLKTGAGPLDTTWFKEAQEGHIASVITAVWAAPLIEQNLPKLAGKWAVAPMPQWNAGEQAAGDNGGSTTAVLKGCKHPKEATEFATWFSTNTDSLTNLIKNTGIYPAAKSGLDLPAVNTPSAYFGGQNIYQVFKTAAENTNPNWVWGPSMTQVESDFVDGLKSAAQGNSSIPDVAKTVQSKTVAAMKNQGLSVG